MCCFCFQSSLQTVRAFLEQSWVSSLPLDSMPFHKVSENGFCGKACFPCSAWKKLRFEQPVVWNYNSLHRWRLSFENQCLKCNSGVCRLLVREVAVQVSLVSGRQKLSLCNCCNKEGRWLFFEFLYSEPGNRIAS